MLGKLSEFNKFTVVWIPKHQGVLGNKEADRLAKEGAIEVPPTQFTARPFSAGKKLIRKQMELKHQARWAACTGCQFKMLMRYCLPSRANKLLAVGKLRLRAVVGLLTGHTNLRAHLYKLGHPEWQECRLCGCDKRGQNGKNASCVDVIKEDSVHIVCDCPVVACKRIRIWGRMFLMPEV